ncbi:hypothetical protein BH23PLA1_BH23PLA1_15930 [soil metagenome]
MRDSKAEHEMLLALLAIQRGDLEATALMEGMNAWADDPSRSLGEVLVERGFLAESSRIALLELGQKHRRLHGDEDAETLCSQEIEGPDAKFVPQSGEGHWEPNPGALPAVKDSLITIPPPDAGLPSERVEGDATSTQGRFLVLEPYASGGLGIVSIAVDRELDRLVALKEIKDRLADHSGSRARFLREAEITGKLEHPGIVPIYGLGTDNEGRPYYAMRFIRGETLSRAISRFYRPEDPAPTSGERLFQLRELLGRFLLACDAIEYAHSRRVVHRDLKPANIMLGPYGETLVVDWGLAKTLNDPEITSEPGPIVKTDSNEPELDPSTVIEPASEGRLRLASGRETPMETVDGSVLGTPAYLSPEQAEGQLDRVGVASDIYGLGATLYSLLTGKPPVEDIPIPEILRRVRRGEIAPPRFHNPGLPRALEAICQKAMALDPAMRYSSARALADDLKHWLADEPVVAWAEPRALRLVRWGRRHRTLTTAITVALTVGLVSLVLNARIRYERAEALAQAQASELAAEAARQAERLQSYYVLIHRVRERAAASRPGWTDKALQELEAADRLRALADVEVGPIVQTALRSLILQALSDFDSQPASDLEPGLNPSCLTFRPDGRVLAFGEFKAQAFVSCAVALLDVETGSVRRLSFPPSFSFQLGRIAQNGRAAQDGARQIVFSPDGRLLVVGARSGQIQAWDLARDEPVAFTWDAHESEIKGLAFGDDAGTLYSCASDGTLRKWQFDEARGRLLAKLVRDFRAEDGPWDLAFHPEGGLACLVGSQIQRLDPDELTPNGPPIDIDLAGNRLSFHPGGEILAVGDWRGITLFEVRTGQVLRTLTDPSLGTAHRAEIGALQFDPTGSLLASASSHDDDRTVKLWEISTGRLLNSIHEGSGAGYNLLDVAFRPDGRQLVLTSRDRALSRSLSDRSALRFSAQSAWPARSLNFGARGSTLARLGGLPNALRGSLWQLPEDRRLDQFDLPESAVQGDGSPGIAFNPSGDQLAVHGPGDGVFLWAPGQPGPETVLDIPAPVSTRFSADGQRLWVLFDQGKSIGVWTLPGGEPLVQWSDPASGFLRGLETIYSFSVSEPRVLAGGRDGLTRLLNFDTEAGTLELVQQWDHRAGPVRALALAPDDRLVAVGTDQGTLFLLDPEAPKPIVEIDQAHSNGLTTLAFSPDGALLASGSTDHTVRLWKPLASTAGASWIEVATFSGATGPILDLAFSADGRQLGAAIEGEFALRLWDLERLASAWSSLGLDP